MFFRTEERGSVRVGGDLFGRLAIDGIQIVGLGREFLDDELCHRADVNGKLATDLLKRQGLGSARGLRLLLF